MYTHKNIANYKYLNDTQLLIIKSSVQYETLYIGSAEYIQNVPGGKFNILGGHSIGHSKKKSVYVHASYSERFPR
jgi:hypothetical protein